MLANIETMVQQLPTMMATSGDVKVGIPESIAARYFAYITIGSATPEYDAMGLRCRYPRVVVVFGYRVAGSERDAELALAELVDEFTVTIAADPTLGGTSDDAVTLDMSRADMPQYQAMAGAETRIYPIVVIGHQQMEDL